MIALHVSPTDTQPIRRRRRSFFRSAPRQNMSLYSLPSHQHLEPDPEPKPYEYGLVGSTTSYPSRGTSFTSIPLSARERLDSMSPLTAQSVPPSAWPGGPTVRPVSQVSGDYLVGDSASGAEIKRPPSWSASAPPSGQGGGLVAQVSPQQEKLIDVDDAHGADTVPELRRPKSMLYVVNQDAVRSPSSASVSLPGLGRPE